MFSDKMNRKIITLMLCIGLITIGASSAMGMRINSNRKLVKPLIRLGMLSNTEEDLGIATSGFLTEDSYEIKILDGNIFQRKKLERCLNNDAVSFFNFVYVKNIDLKITYKELIEDPDNSTECYFSVLYEKERLKIIDESDIVKEIVNIPHILTIKGFTGWVHFSEDVESWNSKGEKEYVSFFFFIGSYKSLELLETP